MRNRSSTGVLRDAALLVALCLAVYLPGLVTTPPIDRDEPRFAQASRQMLESLTLPEDQLNPAFHGGSWVTPYVQDEPRLNKPPLIYWLQSLSAWAFSGGDALADAIWMYRVPSVLGSIAGVLGTYWLGRRMFHPRVALVGASLLAVSAVVVFDAHQARADQVLLGVTTWAMALLWAVMSRPRDRRSPLLWVALWVVVGLGVLVKGLSPIVVLLTLLAMGLLARDWRAWRSARPLLGLLISAAVVAPWAIALVRHVGLETYLAVLFDETVARGSAPKEGHAGPPGYHAIMTAAMFWPGSAFVLLGAWWACRRGLRPGPAGARWKGRFVGRRAEVFLLCWIVPTWLFFEVYSTKLPHYVLPVYPALALLTARGALASTPTLRRWRFRVGGALLALVGAGGATAVVALSFVVDPLSSIRLWAVLLGVGIAGASLLGLRHLWAGRARAALPWAVGAMLCLAPLVHANVLPALTGFSPRLVDAIARHDDGVRPLACAGYHEDSLIFLMRGRITRVVHTETGAWLADHPDGLLLVRRVYRAEGGVEHLPTLESLTGFQFATSDTVTVDLVEASP